MITSSSSILPPFPDVALPNPMGAASSQTPENEQPYTPETIAHSLSSETKACLNSIEQLNVEQFERLLRLAIHYSQEMTVKDVDICLRATLKLSNNSALCALSVNLTGHLLQRAQNPSHADDPRLIAILCMCCFVFNKTHKTHQDENLNLANLTQFAASAARHFETSIEYFGMSLAVLYAVRTNTLDLSQVFHNLNDSALSHMQAIDIELKITLINIITTCTPSLEPHTELLAALTTALCSQLDEIPHNDLFNISKILMLKEPWNDQITANIDAIVSNLIERLPTISVVSLMRLFNKVLPHNTPNHNLLKTALQKRLLEIDLPAELNSQEVQDFVAKDPEHLGILYTNLLERIKEVDSIETDVSQTLNSLYTCISLNANLIDDHNIITLLTMIDPDSLEEPKIVVEALKNAFFDHLSIMHIQDVFKVIKSLDHYSNCSQTQSLLRMISHTLAKLLELSNNLPDNVFFENLSVLMNTTQFHYIPKEDRKLFKTGLAEITSRYTPYYLTQTKEWKKGIEALAQGIRYGIQVSLNRHFILSLVELSSPPRIESLETGTINDLITILVCAQRKQFTEATHQALSNLATRSIDTSLHWNIGSAAQAIRSFVVYHPILIRHDLPVDIFGNAINTLTFYFNSCEWNRPDRFAIRFLVHTIGQYRQARQDSLISLFGIQINSNRRHLDERSNLLLSENFENLKHILSYLSPGKYLVYMSNYLAARPMSDVENQLWLYNVLAEFKKVMNKSSTKDTINILYRLSKADIPPAWKHQIYKTSLDALFTKGIFDTSRSEPDLFHLKINDLKKILTAKQAALLANEIHKLLDGSPTSAEQSASTPPNQGQIKLVRSLLIKLHQCAGSKQRISSSIPTSSSTRDPYN